ncbi:amino acid adenylation domain-containing protein [Lacisediminihabitans profunda]|uniref:Amino acid adenylation domain-containing protein n=1 Tax=Lacisediminihabitans profunda TaxID=2594790 RepID=A0A5C8ULA2_9MICO|nr:amino acid adenylation domain-containing protein [Lacisediminihabitans profunda]TXN28923.1 amino acid adenylation domain-containing protein [Lacisediminihabitans profunda]
MNLTTIIDRMIDQAQQSDPLDTYSVLLGTAPVTATTWVKGKKVYRWFPVAQSRLIPNYLVVLAPSPDNYRTGDLLEFHGRIDNGQITTFSVRRNPLTTPTVTAKPVPPRSDLVP